MVVVHFYHIYIKGASVYQNYNTWTGFPIAGENFKLLDEMWKFLVITLMYVGNIFFFALLMHSTYIHRPTWKSMLTHSICELQRALKNIGATFVFVAMSPLSLPSLSCATLCIAKSTQRPVNFWGRLHEVVA